MISQVELPDDLWQYIGMKLEAVDRIRFCAVCKLWMSLIRQAPWLMLAETEEEREFTNEGEQGQSLPTILESQERAVPPRGFICVGEQQIYPIDFPEVHGAVCLGSTGNWLITSHRDQSIRLLNPFSRQQIHLPSQLAFQDPIHNIYNGFPYNFRHIQLWKIILSSSPTNGRDCIAVALHTIKFNLAIARLGDPNWTTVQIGDKPYSGIHDIIFYKGQLYAINGAAMLLVCDIGDPPRAFHLTGAFKKCTPYWVLFLVEWLGELLMVIKWIEKLHHNIDIKYKTLKFQVYKFDFINNNWNELNSLGDHSLFLGFNTSVSLRCSDYFGLIKKNCIYFTDNYALGYIGSSTKGGHDMGVFSLEDNSITPHFSGVSTSFYSPPLWIVPTLKLDPSRHAL